MAVQGNLYTEGNSRLSMYEELVPERVRATYEFRYVDSTFANFVKRHLSRYSSQNTRA